ncbi:MAG: DcrB-related protein [Myxococcales bacterium]|nr:DcrB-related protein [Myxococcales bacterium]
MNESLRMNEGTVRVPASFTDLSVQILEWRRDDGTRIAMTVQREPLPEGEDLDGYVRRAVGEYYRELSSFRIDARRAVEGARVPALFLSFRWQGEAGLVCQAQGFARLGGKLLLITTTTASARRRAEAEQIVLDALADLHAPEAEQAVQPQ